MLNTLAMTLLYLRIEIYVQRLNLTTDAVSGLRYENSITNYGSLKPKSQQECNTKQNKCVKAKIACSPSCVWRLDNVWKSVSEPSMLLLHYKAITMDTKSSLPQLS